MNYWIVPYIVTEIIYVSREKKEADELQKQRKKKVFQANPMYATVYVC